MDQAGPEAEADGATGALSRPVAGGTLAMPVYEVLKREIVALDVYDADVGLRMDERGLAERLGVSRTPLRGALARLEQEGFVETRPRRGVFVRRKSLGEVVEMLEMWGALESMGARLACQRADEAAIAALARRAEADAAAGREGGADLGEHSEANIAFHRAVLALSGNARMIATGDGLIAHLAVVRRRAARDPARLERSARDHAGIVAAIEARDADLAARRVTAHNARLSAYLRRHWRHLTGENAGDATTPSGGPAA
ncbi:MAG: GntR family transcriptional regulator [Paracoccaceae bacterium]